MELNLNLSHFCIACRVVKLLTELNDVLYFMGFLEHALFPTWL